jgi:D-psicose/D-tagatose/L-ribulose 3-epimerase
MKYGASSYIWVSPFTMSNIDQLKKAKEIGFDIFELAVEDPDAIDTKLLKKAADEIGIDIYICGAFGESRDISSDKPDFRNESKNYIRALIDMAAELESPYVSGPMYSAVGKARLASEDEKRQQYQWAVDNIKEMAQYASTKNIKLAIEPLNRFETDFINTVDQGLEFLDAVDENNVGFLLDTFHMNIEEKSIPASIRKAKGKIFDFHACANDRGTPGEDHFDWVAIRDALEYADYRGPVVIESFTPEIKEIAKAVSMWRKFAESSEYLSVNGLKYLKKIFN